MKELIPEWRNRARRLSLQNQQGGFQATIYDTCADELEQGYHDYFHDGSWETDGSCSICIREMQHEGIWDNVKGTIRWGSSHSQYMIAKDRRVRAIEDLPPL